MKKIELKTRKWLRTIFASISFTAVAFAFQACYGPEPDMFYDIRLTGTVISKHTHLPIKGIKIIVDNEISWYEERVLNYGITDENGKFSFYASVPQRYFDYSYHQDDSTIVHVHCTPDSVHVQVLDIDGIENGSFIDKTIIIDPAHKDEVRVHIELDERRMNK